MCGLIDDEHRQERRAGEVNRYSATGQAKQEMRCQSDRINGRRVAGTA
jgi:hypothetical protein